MHGLLSQQETPMDFEDLENAAKLAETINAAGRVNVSISIRAKGLSVEATLEQGVMTAAMVWEVPWRDIEEVPGMLLLHHIREMCAGLLEAHGREGMH